MTTETTVLTTYDSEQLEARWDRPDEPTATVVFCHPHPQQGGTMTAPLMEALVRRMVDAGMAVLRFNFRGVGESSGTWDGGVGEVHDVDAAVEAGLEVDANAVLAGWSFGAAMSLRWQAVERSNMTWAGIAPPVPPGSRFSMPGPDDLDEARRTIIMGDRDQLISPDDAAAYASTIGAEFHLLTGSDHFFHFREDKVADLLIPALRPA